MYTVRDYIWESQGFCNAQYLKHTLGLGFENYFDDNWFYFLKWKNIFLPPCAPLLPAKSCLVMGFLGKLQTQGTVKSSGNEDLVFPMKQKASLSSSSPFFGILEVNWDITMSWKTDAMEDLKQVGLFVFHCCLDGVWKCIQGDRVGCAWRILMRVRKITFHWKISGEGKITFYSI